MAKKKKSNQQSSSWFKSWYEEKKQSLKFAGSFIAGIVLFFLITSGSWFANFRAPLLSFYAKSSSILLNLFGMATSTNGEQLYSSQFGVNISEGCDAVAPAILFAVSILVFPIAWKKKWPGLLYGLIFLFILNILRIVTLFLTGVYVKSLFDLMHVEIWQALFIIATVLTWIYWLRWSTKTEAVVAKN